MALTSVMFWLLILMLVVIVLFFAWTKLQRGHVAEASAEFELEWLFTMLAKVSPLVDAGFTARDAQWLVQHTMQMTVEQQEDFRFQVQYHGAEIPLHVRLFMSDIEAVSVYFFTVPALAAQLQEIMDNTLDAIEAAAFDDAENRANNHD